MGAACVCLPFGTARADTALTLFGVLDMSLSSYWVNGGKRQITMANSALNSSRFGFTGTEDLGDGKAVSFWLEAPISPNTGGGPAPGTLFTRRSTISYIDRDLGEIRVGRDFTPTFWNDALFDPFGAAGVGTNLLQQVRSTGVSAPNAPFVPGWGASNLGFIRSSNSISYFLPRNLGGFYGQFQYAFHDSSGSTPQPRFISGRAGYSNKQLNASFAYSHTNAVLYGSSVTPVVTTYSVGLSWDFGFARLMGEGLSENYEQAVTTYRSHGFLAGVAVPIQFLTLNASYANVVTDLPGSPAVSKLALGGVYALSKRTLVYFTYARIDNRHGAMLTTGGTVPGIPGAASTGVDIGLRTAF
ncbi:porin [Paraburkholderia susongensis]|uniref:porin n=1 Tax=Paraburkholderia susongensis TaxID=1515439 RepID=UPI00117DC0D8|nr:porin [Paraburkholderia susongensis]